jgi:Trypsin-like peptidase domain
VVDKPPICVEERGSPVKSFLVAVLFSSSVVCAQVPAPAVPPPSTVANPELPLAMQLKKSVIYVETDCLAKISPQDVANMSQEAIAKLPVERQQAIQAELKKQSMRSAAGAKKLNKLSPAESNELLEPAVDSLAPSELIRLLSKLLDITPVELSTLTPAEIDLLMPFSFYGTGFFVSVSDPRVPKGQSFGYLVTNRHVVQPGIEDGNPCMVLNYSLWLNKKSSTGSTETIGETLRMGNRLDWTYSQDDPSVDLAVLGVNPDGYDALTVPEDLFISEENVTNHELVEGDPVLFTGLFIQTFSEVHRLEPIVRSGTLAMLPTGPMNTTLKKPGTIYLTEAHAYHGNSGSPVLVDIAKFRKNAFGADYKVLGVLSGEVPESADFSLQVTSTFQGTTTANSDISIVVPITQLRAILHSAKLQDIRDRFVQSQTATK